MKSLTASDRKNLIRLAASLPKGDKSRRAILAGLSVAAERHWPRVTEETKRHPFYHNFPAFVAAADAMISEITKGLNPKKFTVSNRSSKTWYHAGLDVFARRGGEPLFDLWIGFNADGLGMGDQIGRYKVNWEAIKKTFEKNPKRAGAEILKILQSQIPPELGVLKGTEAPAKDLALVKLRGSAMMFSKLLMGLKSEYPLMVKYDWGSYSTNQYIEKAKEVRIRPMNSGNATKWIGNMDPSDRKKLFDKIDAMWEAVKAKKAKEFAKLGIVDVTDKSSWAKMINADVGSEDFVDLMRDYTYRLKLV
jgi:hypothetical protein